MSRVSVAQVVRELRQSADPGKVEGMARFGISPRDTLGVGVKDLRAIAERIGRCNALAEGLWATDIHEARILAAFADEPDLVTERQMERWAHDLDSWAVTDQVCSNLFDRTPFAYAKAAEWSTRKEEFVKRAGFVLMAALAVHDKAADDIQFERFLPVIERESMDDRNHVLKAVNWALRQIGKRSPSLNRRAISVASALKNSRSSSARWVGSDALRELTSEAVYRKLAGRRR